MYCDLHHSTLDGKSSKLVENSTHTCSRISANIAKAKTKVTVNLIAI